MVHKDDWIRYAISDDRMVTDLLLRLKYSSSSSSSSLSLSSSSSASVAKTSLPPTRWGIRLPRSRMAFRFESATSSPEEKTDSARKSPTTPLAWSAASSSGTANGSDEFTLPVSRSCDSRSKVVGAVDPGTVDAKKSKRKKTFADLKAEEFSLLKERVQLKKGIGSLHPTFKEHTTTNENLKRMKLNFDLNVSNGSTIASDGKEGTASSLEKETILVHRTPPTLKNACQTTCSRFCQVSVTAEDPDQGFLLPDLNMTPSEDDFTLEDLHGVGSAEDAPGKSRQFEGGVVAAAVDCSWLINHIGG